jgi:hypothetical protein
MPADLSVSVPTEINVKRETVVKHTITISQEDVDKLLRRAAGAPENADLRYEDYAYFGSVTITWEEHCDD